jgi:hypothetical protein
VTNWPEYNESLRQRGDLTIWVTDEALGQWLAPRRTTRGGQPIYSDMAITMCLTLGMVYKLPLRQTQGLMRTIARLVGLDIPVPVYSTLDNIGDPSALPDLFDQIDDPVSRFLADGAYDGKPASDLLKARFGDAVEIIIPPPKNAIPSPQSMTNPTPRDRHIAEIHARGRLAWQANSGYNQRSRAEAQIGRWKGVIGPKLKSRTLENQRTEARIGVQVLNIMTKLGRPSFERTA